MKSFNDRLQLQDEQKSVIILKKIKNLYYYGDTITVVTHDDTRHYYNYFSEQTAIREFKYLYRALNKATLHDSI